VIIIITYLHTLFRLETTAGVISKFKSQLPEEQGATQRRGFSHQLQDESSREVVQWLATNLKPEHVAYNDQHSQQYQLSSGELANAAAFSDSLKGAGELQLDSEDTGLAGGRQRTAALLAEAADRLATETAQARLPYGLSELLGVIW